MNRLQTVKGKQVKDSLRAVCLQNELHDFG